MYHFTVTEHVPETIILDEYSEIAGYAVRYLKDFQINAVRFLFNHFCKREFCILNDESGLGKTVTTAVFLGIVATKMNCLVILDNNDELVANWMFHLNVLTDLNSCALTDQEDYDKRAYKVYIVRWNTLRANVDFNKMKFDLVILDNRGQILNNTFCTSILHKGFEKKVQLVLSSIDVTSDVKLMHNILRLGGRLEHNLESFKAFEEKFKLPDLKEIANKKSDLEDYFLKREMLTDYCRDFRLRRYRHQFENFLPLVDEQRFRIFVEEWKEKSTSKLKKAPPRIASKSMPWEIDTEEFLKEFVQRNNENRESSESTTLSFPNQQQSIATPVDVTDDQMDMPPLVFDTDSEDEPDVVFISSDSRDATKTVIIEIDCTDSIDVESSNVQKSVQCNNHKTKKNCKEIKNPKTIEQLQKNITTKETQKRKQSPNTITKHQTTEELNNLINTPRTTRSKEHLNAKSSKNENRELRKTNEKMNKTSQNIKNKTIKQIPNSTDKRKKTSEIKVEKTTPKKNPPNSIDEKTNKNSKTSKVSKPQIEKTISKIKENVETTNESIKPKEDRVTSQKSQRKTKTPIVETIQRETRNMQRVTRSGGRTRKYFALDYENDKKSKTKKTKEKKVETMKNSQKKENLNSLSKLKSANPEETSVNMETSTSKVNKQTKEKISPKSLKIPSKQNELNSKSTQGSILPTSADFEEIQCGQKLQFDTCSENSSRILKNSNEFLMPATPPSLRLISQARPAPPYQHQATPRPMFLDSECDIAIMPSTTNLTNRPTNSNGIVVLLSSSQDEASFSSQSSDDLQLQQKRKRYSKRMNTKNSANNLNPKSSSFGSLLQQQQRETTMKSPDLFSTGSSNNMLCLTQPNRRTIASQNPSSSTFGFKIFGSEVRRIQPTDSIPKPKPRSDRSCLNILEKMFENDTATNEKKTNNKNKQISPRKQQTNNKKMQTISKKNSQSVITSRKSIHDSLNEQSIESEDIFEITNNTTFGNSLRINSNGNISPIQQQQLPINSQHHNKITNYLIGSVGHAKQINDIVDEQQMFGTPKKRTQQQQQQQTFQGSGGNNNSGTLRKSPKNTKGTQTTKLTKWFRRSSVDDTTTTITTNIRSHKESPKDSKILKTLKRRRLDLSFKS